VRRALAAILAVAIAASVAACGSEAEPAAEITIARAAAPADLDPALATDHDTLEALWLVYTPLLSYRHTDGAGGTELIPGLAADLPEVSADGLTYTLILRKDLTYSDGTTAVASDFERAVDRDLRLDSPANTYLREIADITSDDATGQVTITLKAPDTSFAYVLAMPATAPVPEGTPVGDLGDDSPPGIGPYELTEGDGGEVTLTQSASFTDLDIPDIPRGNLAKITIEVVPDSIERTAAVLGNELDSIQGPPATALESEIAGQAGDRYSEHPAASTTYAYLDRSREPFDDPLVREAVRDGVVSTGCSLIPPGMPGYDHDFDTTGCAPDLAAARRLIHQAGAKATPVAVGSPDHEGTTEYVRELRAIGLDARVRPVGGATATQLVTRYASIPEPFDFFEPVADEPLVAAKLAALHREPDAADWGELQRYVLTPPQNYVAPLGHEHVATFFSERMDPASAYVHPLFGNDLTSWRIKEGE
jgi:peptide/nickel transport system substrate-binding protein